MKLFLISASVFHMSLSMSLRPEPTWYKGCATVPRMFLGLDYISSAFEPLSSYLSFFHTALKISIKSSLKARLRAGPPFTSPDEGPNIRNEDCANILGALLSDNSSISSLVSSRLEIRLTLLVDPIRDGLKDKAETEGIRKDAIFRQSTLLHWTYHIKKYGNWISFIQMKEVVMFKSFRILFFIAGQGSLKCLIVAQIRRSSSTMMSSRVLLHLKKKMIWMLQSN